MSAGYLDSTEGAFRPAVAGPGRCRSGRHRVGWRSKAWAALLAGLWAAAAPAQAQSVMVLVPPEVDAGASAEDAEFALDMVSERLREDGYKVISHGQAASAMAALAEEDEQPDVSPHDCTSLDCAVLFRDFFEAEAALRLHMQTGGAEGVRVALTIVESEGEQWTGSTGVAGGELEDAVVHALAVARRRRAERRGPWLSVEGLPRDAEVRVDGELVGTLPFDGRFNPGSHEVEVRAQGHQPERRRVRLPVSSWSERRVYLELEQDLELAGTAEQPLPPAPEGPGAAYDWALGSAMIAGGAALAVILPAMTGARAGKCSDGGSDLNDCPHIYGIDDGRLWGQFAVGLGLIGGGAAVLAKKPIQLMMGGDRRGASLGVRGRF